MRLSTFLIRTYTRKRELADRPLTDKQKALLADFGKFADSFFASNPVQQVDSASNTIVFAGKSGSHYFDFAPPKATVVVDETIDIMAGAGKKATQLPKTESKDLNG